MATGPYFRDGGSPTGSPREPQDGRFEGRLVGLMALRPPRGKFGPARGSLSDDEENLVRPIRLQLAVKVHALAVPVIVEACLGLRSRRSLDRTGRRTHPPASGRSGVDDAV
jgi:hypothetical protein